MEKALIYVELELELELELEPELELESELELPQEKLGELFLSDDAVPLMHLLWKERPLITSLLPKESLHVKPEKSKPPKELKEPVAKPVHENPDD
jgi:hypothetical protein